VCVCVCVCVCVYLNEVAVYGGQGSGFGGVSLYGCADYGYPLKGPPT
jgi:hypothetical protein